VKLIFKNTTYQLLSKILSTFVTGLQSVLIVRELGASTWGHYSVVISYIFFLYVLSDLGLNTVSIRKLSELKKLKKIHFFNLLSARLLISFALILIFTTILFFVPYDRQIKISILITFLSFFFFSIFNTCTVFFNISLKFKYLFYTNLIGLFFSLNLFLYLIPFSKDNIFILFFPMLLLDVLRSIISSFIVFKKILKDKFKFEKLNYLTSLNLIKTSLPLGLALSLNGLMFYADQFILGLYSKTQLGYYAISFKVFELALIIPAFLMNSIFIMWIKHKNLKLKKVTFYLLLLSIPITLFGLLLGKWGLGLLWGQDIVKSFESLKILLLGLGVFFITSPISFYYMYKKRYKTLSIIYIVGFILNIVLNLFLIPKYMQVGAGLSTVVTEAFVLILLLSMLKK